MDISSKIEKNQPKEDNKEKKNKNNTNNDLFKQIRFDTFWSTVPIVGISIHTVQQLFSTYIQPIHIGLCCVVVCNIVQWFDSDSNSDTKYVILFSLLYLFLNRHMISMILNVLAAFLATFSFSSVFRGFSQWNDESFTSKFTNVQSVSEEYPYPITARDSVMCNKQFSSKNKNKNWSSVPRFPFYRMEFHVKHFQFWNRFRKKNLFVIFVCI